MTATERGIVRKQEQEFQNAMSHWDTYKDIESYHTIWLRVYEACKADAKKLLQVSLDDGVFYDRLMTAVGTVIRYIFDNGHRPVSLKTFCYLPTLSAFCGYKAIREDKELSYEQSVSNGYDVAVDILGNRDYNYDTKYEGEDDD